MLTYRNVGLVIVRLSLEEVKVLGSGEGRAGGSSGSHTVVGNDRDGHSHPQSHGGLLARAVACDADKNRGEKNLIAAQISGKRTGSLLDERLSPDIGPVGMKAAAEDTAKHKMDVRSMMCFS